MHRVARRLACILLTCLVPAGAQATETGDGAGSRLVVMSFNIWGGGANRGESIDTTLAVLRAADADVIALQETRRESDACGEHCPAAGASVAPALAKALGFDFVEQSGDENLVWANAILSRHPILGTSPGGLGALIDVGGRQVAVFNVHLPDWPYQPYQLLGIEYDDAPFLDTGAEAIAAARRARGSAIESLLADIEATGPVSATVVCGDFNEPSHRDWTKAAVTAGLHPLAVPWPTLRRLEEAGFTDSWRSMHPDEVRDPGWTWTPVTAPDDPADHHDRIDYVLVRGQTIDLDAVTLVGESADRAGLVVTPWPSDHRAVLARFRF
jgi:endonuclease/exonuclease/phosphatase family metal-dependent hydrolase